MKTYRFEIAAYEEIDIDAETKEEAEEKAKEYWDEKFPTMFGGVEFMKKLETIVTLIQKPTEVEFACPYCKADVSEDFEEFLDDQGLSWSDFSDWKYEKIKCPFCGVEIEPEYEFD